MTTFGSGSHGKNESRETEMDNSFTIKPRTGVQKVYSPRDPVPVSEPVETDLDGAKTVVASGDSGNRQRDPHPDHTPHDVIVDPESREVINRENDVQAQPAGREHPDQALLRQRAYRPARGETEASATSEPHANIKA
jgi:hypothetical protein